MKALKKILIFIFILILFLILGFYIIVYLGINDNHRPYINDIIKISEEYGVDSKLVTAIVKTESNFKKDAESGAGAIGLMQIMPETGEWIADKLDEEYDREKLFEPKTNIKYGVYYLKYLINYYNSVDYAILAYNAGFGNVDTWIKEGILTGKIEDYKNIPFPETKKYIQKVKESYRLNKLIFDEYYLDTTSPKWKIALNVYMTFVKDIFVN